MMDGCTWLGAGDILFVLGIGAVFFLAGCLTGLMLGRGKSAGGSGDSGNKGGGKVEIYVGNLAYEFDDKDLRKAFQPFGKILSARVITNKFNGKSKGFGFVEMAERDQAEKAIRSLNGREFAGRKAVVNEAKSRQRN